MSEKALIGRYLPGTSPLHRMDPRAKMLLALVYLVAAFAAQTFWGLAVVAAFTVAFFRIARITLRQALGSIAPLIFILVITALLNVFFVQSGEVLVQAGPLVITVGGLAQAAFITVRVLLLLVGMSLLTLTTTTLDITDAFERLLAPFARFGLPAHELGMLMGIALRFLPQFVEELGIIYRAQISRGAQISANVFKGGMRTITSLMVPLFTSAFRHAETLSLAMDARCYHGGGGRTRLAPLAYGPLDARATAVLACLVILVVATNFIPQ